MSLLSVAELTALVQTDLDDTRLQQLIDREEAALTLRCGPHGDGVTTVTESHSGGGSHLFLRRRVASVTSISEQRALGGTSQAVAATTYQVWGDQGRLERFSGGVWGQAISVVYVPADDRDLRKQVLIEVCRLALEQTALKSESVAGEYSYTAPDDWERVRARLYKRLVFEEV